MKRAGLCLALAGMLAGCETVTSYSRGADTGGQGVSYSVPMRYLTVEASLEPVVLKELRAAAGKARKAYAEAEIKFRAAAASHAAAKAASDALQAQLKAETEAPPTQQLENRAADAERAATAAETARNKAREAREESLKIYEAALGAIGAAEAGSAPRDYTETVTVKLGPAVRDPDYNFVADLGSRLFSGADFGVEIGENGLLQSADLKVSGAGEEIVLGLARSFAALSFDTPLRTEREFEFTPREVDDGQSCQKTPRAFAKTPAAAAKHSFTFDPADSEAVEAINEALCESGFRNRIRLEPEKEATATVYTHFTGPLGGTEAQELDDETPDGRGFDGLFYRQPRTLKLQVERVICETENSGTCKTAKLVVDRSQLISVPNGAPINVLPFKSALFVTATQEAKFSDGSLIGYNFDKPSELGVAASLPFKAVDAFAESLSELVQLRVNIGQNEATLAELEEKLEGEAAPTEAEAELARVQAELEALRAQLETQLAIEKLRAEIEAVRSGEAVEETGEE